MLLISTLESRGGCGLKDVQRLISRTEFYLINPKRCNCRHLLVNELLGWREYPAPYLLQDSRIVNLWILLYKLLSDSVKLAQVLGKL